MKRDYKNQQRQFRNRARAHFRAEVRQHPEIPEVEILALPNSTAQPTIYVRHKLSLPDMMRGRRATLPWRRVI